MSQTNLDALKEKMRVGLIKALKNHTKEMEGYSYYGSNPGVSEDDYEDVADEFLDNIVLKEVGELVEALEKAIDQLELYNAFKVEQRVLNVDTILRQVLAKFGGGE